LRGYREIAIEDRDGGFAGYLVVDSSDRELSFGGTRIDPSVTKEMVVDLAENMSLKLACHGSPVGGAKAGLRVSPDDPNLKRHLWRFAEACRDLLTSTTIIGKDMGAKQWMLDEIYSSLSMPQLGIAQRRFQTHCPNRLCDLTGYITNMTGKGVFWAIEEALGGDVRGARVLIQGFGVVGFGVAYHLDVAGARIVGVSDRRKAVVNADRIALDVLMAAKGDDGLIAEEKLPETCLVIERDGLLTQPADVLVLAAGSYLVDGTTAAQIQAPVVVEAANMALLPDARLTLHEQAARVVPDVVANSASAALVGHQIATGNTREPRALWEEIEQNIKRSTAAVERVSRERGIDSKSAVRHVIQRESAYAG
jgi:glutamate dehydrogenase (NAD(P)+)